MDHPVRNPSNAPPPTRSTLQSTLSVHCDAGSPRRANGSPVEAGIRSGSHGRSRRKASAAPNTLAQPSLRARRAASPPSPCSARKVSAVAVPVGNGSSSMLMSWRLMGTAVKTPSMAMTASQATIATGSGRRPVSRSSAPMAGRFPPPVMNPADDATDPIALFSSAPNSRRTSPSRAPRRNSAKAITQAVMVTPKLQPTFRTM